METKRVRTGIEGLDQMLDGGLPFGHCVVVSGGPGAGKTVLGIQFLYEGASKYGETGLYVSLDESSSRLKKNVSGFGWDIENLERKATIVIVDATPVQTIPREIKIGEISMGKRDFTMYSLWAILKAKVQEIGAKRVVVDPISSLIFQFPDVTERRKALLDLFHTITDIDATSLVMTELRTTSPSRKVQSEEFLAQGVIVLHTLMVSGRIIRAIQIEKMRGVPHDNQIRPYEITKNGIEVFPKESILTKEI
jgi:KaiC/GvpD/RAD55 family RecA-like ATPase